MIKNIIYLVYWPITNREKARWGLDVFKARGFNIQVCDVSELCNKSEIQRNPVVNALTEDYIYRFTSYDKLEEFLQSTSSNSIYIDYMRGLNDLDSKTEKIFRLLKKHNIEYFTIVTNSLPTPSVELQSSSRYHWFLSRFKKAFHPLKLYHYLVRKTIVYLRGKGLFYPLPMRIFATDAPVVNNFLLKYNLNSNIVVKMHTDDYYDFLRASRSQSDNSIDRQKPYVVFIDEGMVGHSDIDICGIKRLDAQSYSAEVTKIFNYIESNFDMKVIVAAHPRLNLEALKTVYPNRTILQGKTLQLIAGAELVIAHLSTVVGFAALLKKPIILVETAEMRKTDYYHITVHTMANALGVHPFQTDLEALDNLDKYWHCSMEKYDQYVSRYVKTSGASDEDMWDIVSKEAEKESKLLTVSGGGLK